MSIQIPIQPIPPPRTINLTPSQMLFYQLNVIHDIIHDYGFYAAETRWSKNARNVKQFLSDRFTLVVDTSSVEIVSDAEDEIDAEDAEDENGEAAAADDGSNLVGGLHKIESHNQERQRQPLLDGTAKGKTQQMRSTEKQKQLQDKSKRKLLEKLQERGLRPQHVQSTDVAQGPVHDVYDNVDYRTLGLESSIPEVRVAVLTDIYNSHVKKINSNFVEQIKNSIMFNFFGVLFQPSPNGSPTILLNTGPHQYDIYQLAYLVVASTNPGDYTSDENNYRDTMTADEKSLDEFRRDPRWNRNAPTPFQGPIPQLLNLYSCIALKFGDYLSSKYNSSSEGKIRITSEGKIQIIWDSGTINQLYNDLSDFLDSSECFDSQVEGEIYKCINIVDYCIYEVLYSQSVAQPAGQYGGAPTQAEYVAAFAINKQLTDAIFHTSIPAYGQISYFQKLEELIKRQPYPENTPEEAADVYASLKVLLNAKIAELRLEILPVQVDGIEETFPSRRPRNSDQAIDGLKSKINGWLSKYLKPQKKIIDEWNKQQAIAAAQLARQAASAARADLDPESSTVRSGFLKAVASLGLFLNGITKNDIPAQQVIPGQIVEMLTFISQDNLLSNLLITELSILFYYASIGQAVNYQVINPVGKRDLDTVLINVVDNYLKTNESWRGGRYYCNSRPPNNKLYIIDNAAKIPTKDRDNNVFCPLSSIIDGMNQCTLGASGSYSATYVEYGNMNFEITDVSRNAHYKGQLQLCDNFSIGNNVHNTVTYTLQYKGYNNSVQEITTSIPDIQVKNGKIRNLEAHNILKNTLVNILHVFIALLQDPANENNGLLGNYLTTSGQSNLFENLTKVIVTGKFKPTLIAEEQEIGANRKYELLQNFFTILGKGAGDIFQELNAVCKHGGYTSRPTYLPTSSLGIIPWGRDGNTRRFFAANDRPSATRFIFLLKYGRSEQINTQSFGGYISNKEIIAQRVRGQVVCSFMPALNGGSIKRKYKSKKNRIKKFTKKQNKYKLKIKSKKHILFKRNKTKRH